MKEQDYADLHELIVAGAAKLQAEGDAAAPLRMERVLRALWQALPLNEEVRYLGVVLGGRIHIDPRVVALSRGRELAPVETQAVAG